VTFSATALGRFEISFVRLQKKMALPISEA